MVQKSGRRTADNVPPHPTHIHSTRDPSVVEGGPMENHHAKWERVSSQEQTSSMDTALDAFSALVMLAHG